MIVRETIYEHRMYFDKQVRFLWWKWWRRFAEGGDLLEQKKGKLKEVRYKHY
tara:strand:+ start:1824 stop:1979 length:156 start_codon:yes stop_codon:yes gene_type:complete